MAPIRDATLCWNERIKLIAGFLNATGLGLIGFAVLKPITEDFSKLSILTLWWGFGGLAFHAGALYILGRLRKAQT